jgi:hypothetical protein
MPTIDPMTEEPTREMLGHAIRGETQELSELITSVGDERYLQVLGLCLLAAAYVAVDVAGRWPTDADIREIARLVSERGTEVPLDQEDVYDYLSGAALGFKPLPQVMGDELAAATLPVFITGTLLFAFRPEGQKWWEYLDQIWGGYEKAEEADVAVSMLPALQVRARMSAAQAAGRPNPPWYTFPALPLATDMTLAAASAERVAAEWLPDGSVEFSLYRDEEDKRAESYSLEVVLRAEAELPGVVRVRYQPVGGSEPTVLLVPVAAAALGPPASRVVLPGFARGVAWEGSGLLSLDEVPEMNGPVIEASVGAAASGATVSAWRQLAASGGAHAALIRRYVG